MAVFLAMFAAQVIGSAYNIAYNLVHISPLLTGEQEAAFQKAIQGYNFTAIRSWWACGAGPSFPC